LCLPAWCGPGRELRLTDSIHISGILCMCVPRRAEVPSAPPRGPATLSSPLGGVGRCGAPRASFGTSERGGGGAACAHMCVRFVCVTCRAVRGLVCACGAAGGGSRARVRVSRQPVWPWATATWLTARTRDATHARDIRERWSTFRLPSPDREPAIYVSGPNYSVFTISRDGTFGNLLTHARKNLQIPHTTYTGLQTKNTTFRSSKTSHQSPGRGSPERPESHFGGYQSSVPVTFQFFQVVSLG
jgi:hypothetical protein